MTRSSTTPPYSRHMRLYCAWPGWTLDTSFVSTDCRNCSASAPWTSRRPMCEMSNSPATLRTARCSSRIDVYCCGSSQPPKSTIRPPSATWRSYSGVRLDKLIVRGVVDVDLVEEVDFLRVDEREQLVVVPLAGVGHDLRDIARALHRPLELLRQLGLGRRAVELACEQKLGPVVVLGRRDQKLLIAHRGCLRLDRVGQLRGDASFRDRGELGLATGGEGAHRFDEPDRTLLHEVGHRQPLIAARRGQPDDHRQVDGDQALLASLVSIGCPQQQPALFARLQRPLAPGLADQLAERLGVLVRVAGLIGHPPDSTAVSHTPPEADVPRFTCLPCGIEPYSEHAWKRPVPAHRRSRGCSRRAPGPRRSRHPAYPPG